MRVRNVLFGDRFTKNSSVSRNYGGFGAEQNRTRASSPRAEMRF